MFSSLVIMVAFLTPSPVAAHTTGMTCSWYGAEFEGRPTASGEIFRKDDPQMAAHKELPFGTIIVLRNPENNQEQIVVIYDRGPFHEDRDLDVSEAAAKALGFKDDGVTELEATIIEFP